MQRLAQNSSSISQAKQWPICGQKRSASSRGINSGPTWPIMRAARPSYMLLLLHAFEKEGLYIEEVPVYRRRIRMCAF